MVFIEFWNCLHETHRAIQTGTLRTQADAINRLFWFVNDRQSQQFPALLSAQAVWIFTWYLEKVLPAQEYNEADKREIASDYRSLLTRVEQSALRAQKIEADFCRKLPDLPDKQPERIHNLIHEYAARASVSRELLEYALDMYFASKAVLVDTGGQGILVPLQVSVDQHTSGEHVVFWNHAVDAQMQTSADTARSVARRYLLEQFDANLPEKTAVQCRFLNPAVSYHDSSASLMIGLHIVGEVLGLERDPATAVTGELELFGSILSVGNILEKIAALRQCDRISRLILPAANRDECRHPVPEQRLTMIPVRTFAEAVGVYYGVSQILACKRRQLLTWPQVREICADITTHRMATVQGKYKPELYLQRQAAHQSFEHFLKSPEKKCFVLIGKSGVGKSNFLLSLYDEFQNASDDTRAMVMYDGANLRVAPSMTACVTHDVNDRLKPPSRPVHDIWQAVNRIEGIENRLLIVYVDAINENPNAKELLRQVNELVQKPYCWMKVVCSSRPETWQTVRRGVRLAERLYYRQEDTERIGVEFEPFRYSERMTPFSRQELPDVYAKYQQVFNLHTPYEALRSEHRELLRDPLSLWLVAHTFQGQAIPETLKAMELIEQYLQALIRTERLSPNDIRFLETRIVPRMVREGRYRNTIPLSELDAADERLSARALLNLLDCEILSKLGAGQHQAMAFTYERFYEYFVGSGLSELSQAQEDVPAFFRELIRQINALPFLWGAVKHAFVRELQTHGGMCVLPLCATDDQGAKEMLVSALTEFGQARPAAVETLLYSLLPAENRMSTFRSLLQLFGIGAVKIPSFPKGGKRIRNAARIAIEVASYLNRSHILQMAARQPDPTIRTAAVRYSYYLWQRNPEAGYHILGHLAKADIPGAISGDIPDLRGLESVLGLSLLICFDNSRNEFVLRQLQAIWRPMLARMFGLRDSDNWWREWYRNAIRQHILSSALSAGLRFYREMPYDTSLDVSDIEAFFRLGAREKHLYRNLIRYIDSQGDYSQEQMEDDFLATLPIKNFLMRGVVTLGMLSQATRSPRAFLPFLKKFFHEAQKTPPPSTECFSLADAQNFLVFDVLNGVLHHDRTLDDIFDFFCVCHRNIPGMLRNVSNYS